jgi:Tfp pilus assembly protein PilZ
VSLKKGFRNTKTLNSQVELDMDSGVIVTSMGIGAAIFAGLIVFWFFHTFIKRKLGAEQSVQLPNNTGFNGEEMRRHPRIKVSWPAAMEIGHASIKVRLKDISLGGAFVICHEPIPLNEQFRLYIEVPEEETFALNAEVVWSNMNVPEEKVIHRGMGIKFVQNTNAARKRLEKAITRLSREAKLAAV